MHSVIAFKNEVMASYKNPRSEIYLISEEDKIRTVENLPAHYRHRFLPSRTHNPSQWLHHSLLPRWIAQTLLGTLIPVFRVNGFLIKELLTIFLSAQSKGGHYVIRCAALQLSIRFEIPCSNAFQFKDIIP